MLLGLLVGGKRILMLLNGGSSLVMQSAKTSDPSKASKYHLIIDLLNYSWSEFKIGTRKLRNYGLALVKLIYKYLSKKLEIEYSKFTDEDVYLLMHIIEANDITDIKR